MGILKYILGLIAELLARLFDRAPPKPGRLSLASKREIAVSRFAFTFNLPTPSASDVATHEVTAKVTGKPDATKSYPVGTLVTGEWEFDMNDEVSLRTVEIDGAGNRSPASDPLTFVVVDDVAPAAPGVLSVASKRQLP